MLDAGVDSQEISRIMQQREAAPSAPIDWRAAEHLETDFTKDVGIPIDVTADKFDRPSSQRVFGSPTYDQNGNLRCRCCGMPISRSLSPNGEAIACCSNIGCQANGFAYAEGSYSNNPHRRPL
jgi:hypothetical protein